MILTTIGGLALAAMSGHLVKTGSTVVNNIVNTAAQNAMQMGLQEGAKYISKKFKGK